MSGSEALFSISKSAVELVCGRETDEIKHWDESKPFIVNLTEVQTGSAVFTRHPGS